MTQVTWTALYRWELRQSARSSLLWLTLGLLAVAFAWGAASNAGFHREQTRAQQRALAEQDNWNLDMRRRMNEYAQPGKRLPYWQDPTSASGFSRYFLFAQTAKPHLPSSPLAVGNSELSPHFLRVRLETPFGVEPRYDFEHPRGLAIGRFDLAFAIACLLPVGLILLMTLSITQERDSGALRLIAAQAVTPRTWLLARVAALATWVLPALAIALVLGLAVAGAPLSLFVPELIATLALLLAYALFWIALAAWVLSCWPSTAGALGALLAIWAMLAFGLPRVITSLSDAVAPVPPQVTQIDTQRRILDGLQTHRDALIAKAFARDPALAGATDRVAGLDHATRWTFLAPELEARLSAEYRQREAERALAERLSSGLSLLALPVAVQEGMSRLAGTDNARHRRYESATREYQHVLRRFFFPRVQAQITRPSPDTGVSRGRMSFNDIAGIPAYAPMRESWTQRVMAAVVITIWLLGWAAALLIWTARRARAWPREV